MKRIFSLLLVLCIVLLSFAACNKTNDDKTPSGGTSTPMPDKGNNEAGSNDENGDAQTEADAVKAKYDAALALIAEGKLEEAYAALQEISGYADAKTQLGYFHYLPETISYSDGEDYAVNCEYVYDADNRLLQMVCTDIEDGEEYTVTATFTYDANGNLTGLNKVTSDGDTSNTAWIYDVNGNCIKETRVPWTGCKFVYDYTYDTNGNCIKMVETFKFSEYSDDTFKTIYDYTYDTKGNLIKQVCTMTNGTSYINYTYDAAGNLIKRVDTSVYGSKTTYKWTYDVKGNLVGDETEYSGGEKYTNAYTYDTKGNLIQQISTSSSGTSIWICTYDANGNCTKENYTAANGYQTSIDRIYDANGNITKEVYNYGGGSETTDYTSRALAYIPYALHDEVIEHLTDWEMLSVG